MPLMLKNAIFSTFFKHCVEFLLAAYFVATQNNTKAYYSVSAVKQVLKFTTCFTQCPPWICQHLLSKPRVVLCIKVSSDPNVTFEV